MKKHSWLAILIMILAIAGAVVEYLILPDVLVVQISDNPNTMPKVLGIGIALMVSVVFSWRYLADGEHKGKNLLLAALGLVILLMNYLLNQ